MIGTSAACAEFCSTKTLLWHFQNGPSSIGDMSFDDTDFIDREFQASTPTAYAAPSPGSATGAVAGGSISTTAHPALRRPPTREELETKVNEAQSKLSELRRAQEELERERAALEESRRRRTEFQTGREEMVHQLTRGIAMLEESEFAARQGAEQQSRSLLGLRAGGRRTSQAGQGA